MISVHIDSLRHRIAMKSVLQQLLITDNLAIKLEGAASDKVEVCEMIPIRSVFIEHHSLSLLSDLILLKTSRENSYRNARAKIYFDMHQWKSKTNS